MKWLLYLFPLYVACSDSTSLTSLKAFYEGDFLNLEGLVHLDHRLGVMEAEKATLKRKNQDKEFPFSEIKLEKNVHFQLKDQGEIHCESAHFDLKSLQAIFSSSDEVVYQKRLKPILSLKSPYIQAFFKEKPKTLLSLDSMTASKGVKIDYGLCQIQADNALFQENEHEASTVIVYPQKNSLCKMTYHTHTILGSSIRFDLSDQLFYISEPQGNFPALPHKNKSIPFSFTANELTWAVQLGLITLKNKVWAESPLFGTLTAKHTVKLTEKEKKNKKVLSSLQAQGETTLVHPSSQKLISPHYLLIDYEKGQAYAEGNGEKQVSFENKEFFILSDQAQIDYNSSKQKPSLLHLKGNVKLKNIQDKKLACASCDELNYDFLTETLILSALPGKRALFWNQEQNIRISSQEVHITRDPLTKKECVKGKGNVRFTFSLEENQIFRNLFSKYGGRSL